VADATAVAALLAKNEDGSPNFDVKLLTSDGDDVSNWGLTQAVSDFFRSSTPVDTAVLYFAGHGVINKATEASYMLGADGRPGAYGLAMSELLRLANGATNTIPSSVIILDCCHAGFLGEISGIASADESAIGKGVTVLSACNADQKSKEVAGHGVFTRLLLWALRGGAADLRGHVTPAAVYAQIDQALGAFDQRPLYKANVHRFVNLRQVKPKIPLEVLRRLAEYFPHVDTVFRLKPSYEPDREYVAEKYKDLPVDPEHTAIFAQLQMFNRQGLVVPVDAKDMFSAAMNSTGCALTPIGQHYQRLAAAGKL
jgi:Caspase domain